MSELISEGLNLALFGMGTVFVFLFVLVITTLGMSALVQVSISRDIYGDSSETEDLALLAAISAAIRQYRKDRNSS